MAKVFNTTANCRPGEHYMVCIDGRLAEIKKMVDAGKYFTINRARQYGKTTTLRLLRAFLQKEYYVVSMDFQMFGMEEFKDENTFSISFAQTFLWILKSNHLLLPQKMTAAIDRLDKIAVEKNLNFRLQRLFRELSDICLTADKPIVLLIDEIDSATNNQVFLDFLAQLRAYYIDRDIRPTFQSVVLAGVYDVKNLKRKFRSEEEHKTNSPWNIAADFNIDLSFSKEDIRGMLKEYEEDYHTGMDMDELAGLLHDYTSGYPFLVSRLCKLMDEEVSGKSDFASKSTAWTKEGFYEAVRMILSEKNTLFESLVGKLTGYSELNEMLRSLLFMGKRIPYNVDAPAVDMAEMFGFIKNDNGRMEVANRIFETRLYNLYLSKEDICDMEIQKVSQQDRNQFIEAGHLNMRRILEKFAIHFNDLYGDSGERFVEEEGRKYFLLYLRPIINGTGNYYVEARTRSLGRTDVIVDYHGEQFVIEMKIWHGNEYNTRGEEQLKGYLDDYHIDKGYMVSFNFNKRKKIGVSEIAVGSKTLIEAVV